jgi:hypothetical protein
VKSVIVTFFPIPGSIALRECFLLAASKTTRLCDSGRRSLRFSLLSSWRLSCRLPCKVFGLLCSAGKRLWESAGAIPRILGRLKAEQGGVAPALSAFLPAFRSAFLVRASSSFTSTQVFRRWKTVRKTVRKHSFRSVFHQFLNCDRTLSSHSAARRC